MSVIQLKQQEKEGLKHYDDYFDALKVKALAEIKTRDQLTRAYKIIGTTINKSRLDRDTVPVLDKIEERVKNLWIGQFNSKLYYATLGLSYRASEDEIEQTYDELENNDEREAYQVLSISLLKDAYDNYLKSLYRVEAEKAFKEKNWSETIAKATEALEMEPANDDMWIIRARAYYNSGDVATAVSDLDRMPNSKSATELKAEILLEIEFNTLQEPLKKIIGETLSEIRNNKFNGKKFQSSIGFESFIHDRGNQGFQL